MLPFARQVSASPASSIDFRVCMLGRQPMTLSCLFVRTSHILLDTHTPQNTYLHTAVNPMRYFDIFTFYFLSAISSCHRIIASRLSLLWTKLSHFSVMFIQPIQKYLTTVSCKPQSMFCTSYFVVYVYFGTDHRNTSYKCRTFLFHCGKIGPSE